MFFIVMIVLKLHILYNLLKNQIPIMSQNQKSKYFDKIWGSSLVAITLVIIYLYLDSPMFEFVFFDQISLFLYTVIPGSLVIIVVWLVIKSDRIKDLPKKSVVFLAMSFISWFTAEQLWNFYEQVLGIDPFPSVADVFYISAPFFMFVSLMFFLKPFKKQISKKIIFFAISISAALLIPTVVIISESSHDELLEIVIGIIYPVSDSIVLVPVIITILFVIKKKTNPFWMMILIGMLMFITADTIFLFLESTGEYTSHHPVEILWLLSYLIWFYSLWRSMHNSKYVLSTDKEISDHQQHEIQKLTKYGIVIFLIVINITVVIVLFGMQQLQSTDTDIKFLNYFSVVLVMLLVIFSTAIILLNKKLYKNLEYKTIELEHLSEEFIKSERLSAIGELSARLAHDLRNPLSVIKMSVELIKNTLSESKILDSQIITRIDLIDKSVNRIAHQIDDVLDYVRSSPLKISNVSAHHLLLNSIEKIKIPDDTQIIMPEKNVTFNCDPIKLEAVFINLIINAIQAIPDTGNIEIKINEKNDDVIFEFIDSGNALLDENVDKIFEPLFTTKQKGTGLGLAICKNIIEQHGGTIQVTTHPTTFTVTIPNKIKR
ncbi:MAG: two-component sensor histidine kinase [Nitrosopumilales archaeon CG_4_9_14_0_2_um_filter_34_16]|nr:MAG: two-component sensor histidine kinase [Nitrosopumilales archaeon CG_4_9_14_0_2_um_filter_34_16]